jgi:hypothetical protein
MNERIQELAVQVYGSAATAQEIKFAELIVQECAEVSKNYAGGSMPLSIALAIKKHFGVEK